VAAPAQTAVYCHNKGDSRELCELLEDEGFKNITMSMNYVELMDSMEMYHFYAG
jgi:hypothetical protein